MVAGGILAVLLVVLKADVDQVQGAANPSAGGLPSLELQVTAIEKALSAKVSTLEFRVRELENQVFGLSQFISVDYGVINGLKGPHVLITDANVHIRSGSGETVDTTNLGNLIVGYNEPRLQAEPTQGPTRSGSHNFIVPSSPPLAVLPVPPLTLAKTPLIVFPVPTTRPPDAVYSCAGPTMKLWEPERVGP